MTEPKVSTIRLPAGVPPTPPPQRYFAKPDTWFDAGTEAELLGEPLYVCFDDDGKEMWAGLFSGTKDGKPDEEICTSDEFDIRPL